MIKDKIDPIILVVIPTHNRLDGLLDSIQSILNQTAMPKEVKAILITNKPSKGANNVRNQGNYISFLDDEDQFKKDKIELIKSEIIKNPNANVFLSSGPLYFGKGSGASSATGCDVSSWKAIVYNHGIIGFVLIVSIYIIILLYIIRTEKILDKKVLLLTYVVFALSFYQRPNFSSLYFIILFYSANMQYRREDIENRNRCMYKVSKRLDDGKTRFAISKSCNYYL
jgi:glycosyltransferase involved in cell wall biosynthesis